MAEENKKEEDGYDLEFTTNSKDEKEAKEEKEE